MSNEEIKKSIISHFQNDCGGTYDIDDIFFQLMSDEILDTFIKWHKKNVFDRYAENLDRIESMKKMIYDNVVRSRNSGKSIEAGFRLGYNTCLEIIKEDFKIWMKKEAEADLKK